MSDIHSLDDTALQGDPLLAGLLASRPPKITPETAENFVREHWGIVGHAKEIACERDQNFRIEVASGSGYIFKLSNPHEDPQNTNFQTEALRWVERTDPGLPVPRSVPALNACHEVTLALPDGRRSVSRVLSWIDGIPMHQVTITHKMHAEIGTILARLGRAISAFDHPGARHALLWDITNVPRLRPLTVALAEDAVGQMVRDELDYFVNHVATPLSALRRQIVHNDLNHHNLLVDPADHERIIGMLDFGDMVETHLAIDVAVAASYLADAEDPVGAICRMVAAYHAVTPLQVQEVALLRDLIVARLITSIIITTWRAARYPENAAYILRNNGPARAAMAHFAKLPRQQVTRALMRACDME